MSRSSENGFPVDGATITALARAARALTLAAGLALIGVVGAGAQATPSAGLMASPAAGPCQAPNGSAAAPAASPMASPVSPAEATAPAGTPVSDQTLIDEAVAAATNVANCWNAGEVDAIVGLVTPHLLQTRFGAADADQGRQLLGSMQLPPIAVISTGDVQTYDDGRASLDFVYMLGDHQYTNARWYMVDTGNGLLIDEEQLLTPNPDVEASTVLGVSFAADDSAAAFDQGADETTGGREVTVLPAIILHGTNNGTKTRFLSVVHEADGAAGTPAAGAMPHGEFVAQFAIAPGDQADVALVNLEPGTYAVGEEGGDSVPLTIAPAS